MLTTTVAVVAETVPVLWYANRASGFVLLALLTLTTVAGVLARSAPGSATWPRAATQSVHRNVGLLAAVFLVVHVVTSAVDEFVDIRWWHALVPFTGSYERPWLGLGVVALDMIIAIVITSLARRRLSHGWWRAIHFSAYAVWILGVVHGLAMGTDSGTRWGQSFTVVCALLVAVAVGARLMSVGARPPIAGAPTTTPVSVSRRMNP